jgi:hypothetical protein
MRYTVHTATLSAMVTCPLSTMTVFLATVLPQPSCNCTASGGTACLLQTGWLRPCECYDLYKCIMVLINLIRPHYCLFTLSSLSVVTLLTISAAAAAAAAGSVRGRITGVLPQPHYYACLCRQRQYPRCHTKLHGRMVTGSCSDKLEPCGIGACCGNIPLNECMDSERDNLRGDCSNLEAWGYPAAPFFKGETCQDSCRVLSLGACCTRANLSTPATCVTGKTFKECAYNPATHSTSRVFLGFSWNKTCAEANCER